MKIKTLFIGLVFAVIAVWILSHIHMTKTENVAVAATNQTPSAPAQQPIQKSEFKKMRQVGESGKSHGTHRTLGRTIK